MITTRKKFDASSKSLKPFLNGTVLAIKIVNKDK